MCPGESSAMSPAWGGVHVLSTRLTETFPIKAVQMSTIR
jgi:hypothetical protein